MKEAAKKIKRFSRRSIVLPFFIVGIVVIIISFFIVTGFLNQTDKAISSSDNRVTVEKPKAQQVINKVLFFPLRDSNGDEVSKLKYEIINAELRDQIIVKGQKATNYRNP